MNYYRDKRSIEEVQRRINLGLRFRGIAFKETDTYGRLMEELYKLRGKMNHD